VAPSSGGPRTLIAGGEAWQDKPRWSADGKQEFFVAERNGYLNVFSVPFDPAHGRTNGEIWQVTDFTSPEFAIADVVPTIGSSVVGDKMMITMA
jgi:Tol biopolymer transport system component